MAAASLLVLLFVAGTMHWRAEQIVSQVYASNLQRMDTGSSFPLSDELNAHVVYDKVAAAYQKGTAITWEIEIAEREPVAPPPVFPDDQLPVLNAMQQASKMLIEVGQPGRLIPEVFVIRGCKVLQLDAVDAAMAGDFKQAAADIAAMQRLAGQLASDADADTSVAGMLANGRRCRLSKEWCHS